MRTRMVERAVTLGVGLAAGLVAGLAGPAGRAQAGANPGGNSGANVRPMAGVAVAVNPTVVWDHRVGEQRAVRVGMAEYRAISMGPTGVEFDVVVSESGRVESATATNGPATMFDLAKTIELGRSFKPFRVDGMVVRAKIQDYVRVLPPEVWLEPRVAFPALKDISTVRMSLRRTTCFGPCPDYSVEVTGAGKVTFTGNRDVLVLGRHTAQIAPEAAKGLLDAFRKADFFSLRPEYVAGVTDNPTYAMTLTMDGVTKKVVDYVGLEKGLPDSAEELERAIDEVAGTARWIKGDTTTLGALDAEGWDFRAETLETVGMFNAAIERGNETLTDRFLKVGAAVTVSAELGASPLTTASLKGDLRAVQRMVTPAMKFTPEVLADYLAGAARSGNVGLVEFWIAQGANPAQRGTMPTQSGTGPAQSGTGPARGVQADVLQSAVSSGKADVVKKILEYPVGVREEKGILFTALNAQLPDQIEAVLKALIDAGADVRETGMGGVQSSVLMQACQSPKAIRLMVGAGADLNARNFQGDTAAIYCIFAPEGLHELLAEGADPTAANRYGLTALKACDRTFDKTGCTREVEAALARWAKREIAGSTP